MQEHIETTLGECAAAEPAFERLATRELPVRIAYQLTKLLKAVQRETEFFKQERQKLIDKHGEVRDARDEAERALYGPRVVSIKPAEVEAFNAYVIELAAVPVTIQAAPFDLAQIDGAAIAPRDLLLLTPFVTMAVSASHG